LTIKLSTKVIGRLFELSLNKVAIQILQGSLVTLNRVRWSNYRLCLPSC